MWYWFEEIIIGVIISILSGVILFYIIRMLKGKHVDVNKKNLRISKRVYKQTAIFISVILAIVIITMVSINSISSRDMQEQYEGLYATIPIVISENIVVVVGRTYRNYESRLIISPTSIFSSSIIANITTHGNDTKSQTMSSGHVEMFMFGERTFSITIDEINWSANREDRHIVISIREYIEDIFGNHYFTLRLGQTYTCEVFLLTLDLEHMDNILFSLDGRERRASIRITEPIGDNILVSMEPSNTYDFSFAGSNFRLSLLSFSVFDEVNFSISKF